MRIHLRAWISTFVIAGLGVGLLGSSAAAVTGAEPVADGALPFVAKVTFGDVRSCTGALVDARWIITGKSCFTDGSAPLVAGAPARPTTVLLGRADLTKATGHQVVVQSVIPHPDRNIALAELAEPVKDITPVRLDGGAAEVGESLRIAGYGRTATEWVPDRLHASTFTVQSTTAESFEVQGASGGATLCKGDGGGPAFRETANGVELVGISDTSWQKGCLGVTETREGATEARADVLADWVRVNTALQPQGLREPVTGEFTRDGRLDLVAADSAGKLWLYPGTGTPNLWGKRVLIGTGWGSHRAFTVGRINRDEWDDLVAIDSVTSTLRLYPGTATGGAFGPRVDIGTGWGPHRDLTVGKVNRDEWDDLLSISDTDNKLYLYAGNAAGTRFTAGVVYGTGWNCCTQMTLGRFNDDAYDDLLTVDIGTGKLRVYPGTAAGQQFGAVYDPGAGTTWGSVSYLARGRFDGTGLDGLLAVDKTSGETWLHPRVAGGGWGARIAPLGRVWVPQPYELTKLVSGEFTRDAYPDLVGTDAAGVLWLHPGTAARTFGPRIQIGTGWGSHRDFTVGRVNRDEWDDLVAVDSVTSTQRLFPGTATGGAFGPRVDIGTGWGPHRDLAIGKVNRDEWDDLLSISDTDNKLYLYAGNATGPRFTAGVVYGSGWNCCTQMTLGRFNDDAYDDLLTVDSGTGKLRVYPGTEGGQQFGAVYDPGAGEIWKTRTDLVVIQFAPGENDSLLSKEPSGALVLNQATPAGTPDWAVPIRFGPRD